MKTILLLFVLSLSAAANSVPITTFQLSGVGSGMNVIENPPEAELFSSDPRKNLSYQLEVSNTTGDTSLFTQGGFSLREGETFVVGNLPQSTLSNGIFSGAFTGEEIMRLKPGDWIWWLISGNLSQQVNFHAPSGTGSIQITSSVFEGKYPIAPEPEAWMLMAAGSLILLLLSRRERSDPTANQLR